LIKDCLEIFKKQYNKFGDKMILDNYIPADGTYIIVDLKSNSFKSVDIKQDKKTKIVDKSVAGYYEICAYDYNSKLIDMNKPIDGKKVIHSNNYLSFFIKKENITNNKLNDEVIENYYSILENPKTKYSKSKKATLLYETIEKEIGEVDVDLLNNIKNWIKDNIFKLNVTGKEYLKIFFSFPIDHYQREGKRYLIPNIYNNNDFNINSKETILGLPNDNIGLNSKKPYLENKTRKNVVPYYSNINEVILQRKFFDYLMNFVTEGKVNIYINDKIKGFVNGELPDEDFKGVFLRLKKGKEVEIHNYDTITCYKPNLKEKFEFKNILEINMEKSSIQKYGIIKTVHGMQDVINEVFFSKYLIGNYFTDPGDIPIKSDGILKSNLILSRDLLFNWFYKGINLGVYSIIKKASLALIKGSIENGYLPKASHQFNLRWSIIYYFTGGENMADIIQNVKSNLRIKINSEVTEKLDEDKEYYFAVGQLVNYFLSKNKGKKKPHSLANPFINAKNNEIIKEKLRVFYKKYNYDIDSNGRRFKNLYAMIVSYIPAGKVDQDMIIAGYLHNNLIYESDKKEAKNNG
jgi:CRISPR-associated protein Csh1